MAGTALQHEGQYGLGECNLAHHIHIHQFLIDRHIGVFAQRALRHTGVVNQKINGFESIQNRLYRRGQRGPIGHIQREHKDVISSQTGLPATARDSLQFTCSPRR